MYYMALLQSDVTLAIFDILGIDDMFVIMQSLYNIGDTLNENVVDTMATAIGKSGVAITVTSLTDVLAFGIGSTTVSFSVGEIWALGWALFHKNDDIQIAIINPCVSNIFVLGQKLRFCQPIKIRPMPYPLHKGKK